MAETSDLLTDKALSPLRNKTVYRKFRKVNSFNLRLEKYNFQWQKARTSPFWN